MPTPMIPSHPSICALSSCSLLMYVVFNKTKQLFNMGRFLRAALLLMSNPINTK